MNLKYYLRGLGVGIVVTSLILGIGLGSRKETLSNEEIKERARELGMVEESITVAEAAAQKEEEAQEAEVTVAPVPEENAESDAEPIVNAEPEVSGEPAVSTGAAPETSEEPNVSAASEPAASTAGGEHHHQRGEEYSDYIDVTEESPFKDYTTLFPKPKGLHFINANTTEVDIQHLKNDCIVPVFSKDNELTVSHPVFIETVYKAAQEFFRNEQIDTPEIIVSHIIKGRIPEAIHKPVSELLETDKTIYYERMAFAFEIPTIYSDIAGNRLNLCITGVRAYNHENLMSKKGTEHFSVAIGFRNQVCCNLCTFTDGYQSDLRAMNHYDLFRGVMDLFSKYDANKHLRFMQEFQKYSLTEHQFAQFLGKSRMYQCLPSKEKRMLPNMEMTDSQINTIARNYYIDENFAKEGNSISMWRVYNLLTGANKSSYIDNFLDRSLNATQLTEGLSRAVQGDSEYRWFID